MLCYVMINFNGVWRPLTRCNIVESGRLLWTGYFARNYYFLRVSLIKFTIRFCEYCGTCWSDCCRLLRLALASYFMASSSALASTFCGLINKPANSTLLRTARNESGVFKANIVLQVRHFQATEIF